MFVGEDLDILLGICDRILVLSHGKVMGIVPAKGTTKEQIGFLMLGEEGIPTLLKIVKKTEVTGVRAVIYRLIAIVGALMFGSLIMMFMGYNPIDIF